jgi:putative alpha-1,2-mannosidase
MYFDFDMAKDEAIEVQMALSPVSTNGALYNLGSESSGKSFDQLRSEARSKWEKELNKISMSGSDADKVNFYTALYHTYLSPHHLSGW